MGDFPVRYDSRVVIYDRRGFIRLATGHTDETLDEKGLIWSFTHLPIVLSAAAILCMNSLTGSFITLYNVP